jgi:Secretion system C-terminal sorting domain
MLKRSTALAIMVLLVGFSTRAFATKNVQFQVHMGIYAQLGQFTLGTDTVVMRGDFQTMAGDTGHYGSSGNQNWGGKAFMMAPSTTNDSIYTLTIPFPDSAAGKKINYKFVIINAANPYVDSVTNGGNWESVSNRVDSITTDANQVVPLVYFNDRLTAGVTYNITFQADMTALLAAGFDPSVDSIGVMGPFPPTNWGTQVTMAPVFGTPTTYAVTIPITAVVGSQIVYKLHAMGQDLFTNGGWENSGSGAGWDAASGNRAFPFPSADTTLAAVAPNLNITAATTAADTVTFTVNMTGAMERYHNTAITGVTGVYIAGADAPLKWPSNWTFPDTAATTGYLLPLYDDGNLALHGDSTAGDGKWSTIIVFPTQSVAALQYKYGAIFNGVDTLNGGASYLDNEAGYANNHTVVLAGTHQYVYNKFGDQITAIRQNPNAVKVPTKYDLSQNYPNPFNPTTQINFSVPKNSFVTLKVYNVLGQEVATLFSGMQKAGNYVATFDANRFASGVYFYRLQAGTFSSVKKMMLLK